MNRKTEKLREPLAFPDELPAGPEDPLEPASCPALDAMMRLLRQQEGLLAGRPGRLFLRARYHEDLPEAVLQQTRRPEFDRLLRAGLHPVTREEGLFDACLYLGTPQREENLANFGRGLLSLRPGGLFLCSMPNDLGAGRYEKILRGLAPLEVQFSKFHSRVFGVVLPEEPDRELLAEWAARAQFRRSDRTGLFTCPGLFGWDKIDEGSQLLARHLPVDLKGCGADLGAGYGYLAHSVLSTRRQVARLDLFEAEEMALQAARLNLRELDSKAAVGYHWHDVTTGIPSGQYDWIVMNPPFHQGRARSLELGARFVRLAARGLRRDGVLYMVANRHLPYEGLLEEVLGQVRRVAETPGFKVLSSWR